MSTQVSLISESMLDPRGDFRRKSASLAKRHASLKGKKILLFDNSQLASMRPSFGPMFRWLSEYLEGEQGSVCSYQTQNLLKGSKEELMKLAKDISQSGVDGVVISLCNAGITQPTSLFAAELESNGMPCVQICTSLGCPLAAVTAANYAPGLPIVLVEPATGEEEVFGKAEAAAIAPEVAAGLTSDPATLLERFRARFTSSNLRFSENGKMQLPAVTAPLAEAKGGATVSVDPGKFAEDLYDELCAAELSDGLPVIPPTERRVEAMLGFTDLDPDLALINEMPPGGATITVRTLAVNAVMAGCRPEYFPVVVAVMQAIADPAYRVFQGAITTHPAGNAIVVSGPLADELGIQSGAGCLGPGFRANASIGRAINLTLMNGARAIPGKSDMGNQGSPAEFTYCFAESDQGNPWQPLHTELYGAEFTSVTVNKCEGPHNVLDPRGGAEALLRTVAAVAATPGGNNLVYLGQLLVMLNPRQARYIAKEGWSKRDVKEFLFEMARQPIELSPRMERAPQPPYYRKLDRVPVMRSPDDVILVVCGGTGGHASVGVPWGLSQAVSRPVALKDGSPLKTLKGRLR